MNSRLGVTAAADMAVLPGVLWCRLLRRTVQVRKPIPRYRGTVTRWPARLALLAWRAWWRADTTIFAVSRQQFMKYLG